MAHSDFVGPLLTQEADLIDFVEIPFELLLRNPAVAALRELRPVVLHCASLSLAGNVPPSEDTVAHLQSWVTRLGSPWIGEHLAYIRATSTLDGSDRVSGAESEAFDVGYTVSPQYGAGMLERVVEAHTAWEARLGTPILLENGPVVFEMPGKDMSQFDFLAALCARLGRPRLLLDLSHLLLTCRNGGHPVEAALDLLPLEAVVEVHIAGVRQHGGLWWDDHARPAEPLLFTLLERVLARVRPRAITFEYNWDGRFPRDVLRRHVETARELAARAGN